MAALTLAKTAHTMTQDEINQGWAVVDINWKSPFNDTNYAVTFSIENMGAIGQNYFEGDVHGLTAHGFHAIVFCFSPGVGTAGDEVIVHAMAMHE